MKCPFTKWVNINMPAESSKDENVRKVTAQLGNADAPKNVLNHRECAVLYLQPRSRCNTAFSSTRTPADNCHETVS